MTLKEFYRRAKVVARRIADASYCHVDDCREANLDCLGGYSGFVKQVELDTADTVAHLRTLLDGTVWDLEKAVDAVATVYHEHIHALGSAEWTPTTDGFSLCYEALDRGDNGPLSFSDGLTDLWVQHTLDTFLEETGLLKIEPRLKADDFFSTYRIELEAVHEIVRAIGDLARISDEWEVVRLLARETPDTRGQVVASLIGDANGLTRSGRASVTEIFNHLFDERPVNSDLGPNAAATLRGHVNELATAPA